MELAAGHSRQQHLQLQLDSAAAESSALTGELESELDNVAQLVAESQEEQRQRTQVTTSSYCSSHKCMRRQFFSMLVEHACCKQLR